MPGGGESLWLGEGVEDLSDVEQVVVNLSSLRPKRHIHPHLLLRIDLVRLRIRLHQERELREKQGFQLFLECRHWDIGHGGDFLDGEGGLVVEQAQDDGLVQGAA